MNFSKVIGLAALLVLASCKSSWNVNHVETQKNISINQNFKEDEVFNKVIAPYKRSLEQQMGGKIAHTSVDLSKQGDNSPLGNLLADYTYEAAVDWARKNHYPAIDAALINIGGIRTSIGKGDIYLKNLYEVSPFDNELVIVKFKGASLHGLFEYYLKEQKNNPVSRMLIATEQGTIKQALIGGKPIESTKDYYIATSDYLVLGGDRMYFFAQGEATFTGLKLRDLYIEKFKKTPEIIPPTDVRLIFN